MDPDENDEFKPTEDELNEIHHIWESGDTTLQLLMEKNTFILLLREKFQDVRSFIQSHTEDFFQILLTSSSTSTTNALMLMMAKESSSILESILSLPNFSDRILNLLSNEPSSILLNRIGTLTELFFNRVPLTAIAHVQYLKSLLHYAYEPSIYSSYQIIFSHQKPEDFNADLETVQVILSKSNLPQALIEEIKNIDYSQIPSPSSIYSDPNLLLCGSLFKLFTLVSNNPIYGSIRDNSEYIIHALNNIYLQPPPLIDGYRWQALSAFIKLKNASLMEDLIPIALSVLYQPTTNLYLQNYYSFLYIYLFL